VDPGSTFFTSQQEIVSYVGSMSDKYDVTSHIKFNTSFTGAKWNEETNNWSVQLTDLSKNESH
jgi:cation diffusion facilitator CzcD-associated flavoprotein CzcO